MQNEETPAAFTATKVSPEKIYDVCAPAVYGKIMSIVNQPQIAEVLLEKVFVNAFQNEETFTKSKRSPLITLLEKSGDKTEKTAKALNIFRECCSGTTVSGTKKK